MTRQAAGRTRNRGMRAWWFAPSATTDRSRRRASVAPLRSGPGAHHPAPSQTDLQGDLVDLWITGGQVTGYQPRIIRQRRQQVARAQVARPDPLIPGHPFRRQQRRRPRHQHDLADRRVFGTRASGHDDSPLPALITGQMRQETVGSAGRIFVSDAEVVTHRVGAAELDDRRPRRLHGVGEQGRQLRRPLRWSPSPTPQWAGSRCPLSPYGPNCAAEP